MIRRTAFALQLLATLTAGFAMAAPPAAAQDGGVVWTAYDVVWSEADYWANCGFIVLRAPLTAGRQSTGPVDYAEGLFDGLVWNPASGYARGQSESVFRTIDYVYNDYSARVLTWGDTAGQSTKCLLTDYLVWAAEVAVWTNAPVACYAQSTITCGIPKAVCTATYPAKVLVWASNPFQPVPSAGDCLPPGGVNCVQTPLATCIPPWPGSPAFPPLP